jgi:hypothetical protein
MTGEIVPSAVGDKESLARFILSSRYIRNSDQTVKPDAFIPSPHPDLSVTRHLYLSEDEIWRTGQGVADTGMKTLYGRADFHASDARKQLLEIKSDASLNNPNHAIIIDWPAGKPAQKIIAQQIAANSSYRAKP